MDTEDTYCRLCADLKQCSDVTNLKLESNAAKRREIVNKLLRFQIPVDFKNNLPKTVCFKCVDSLDRAFDFVTTVEQAQTAFNTEYCVFFEEKRELYSDGEHVNNEYDDNINKSFESDSETKFEITATSVVGRHGSKNGEDSKDTVRQPWSDISWICGYCDKLCSTVDRLKIHTMQFHGICNVFTCYTCNGKEYSLNKLISHICKHQPSLTLTCYKCFEKFSSLKDIKKHKLTHLTSKYFCSGCNTNFPNPEQLEAHINTFYKDKLVENSELIIKSDSLVCVICQKTMKSKVLLSRHLHTHTERRRNHTCDVCGKGFYLKKILQQHAVVHTDERPYECKICKSAYKLKSEMRKHVALHYEPKSFECAKCGRCFRQKKELQRHEIVHTKLRPYKCAYCEKDFRFQHLLKQHIRLHTGIKPYSCDVCPRTFTNWANYNKHMKGKHGIDKAKRKKTKDGLCAIDQTTGKVLYLDKENEEMIEWKNEVLLEQKKGRPKKIKLKTELKN